MRQWTYLQGENNFDEQLKGWGTTYTPYPYPSYASIQCHAISINIRVIKKTIASSYHIVVMAASGS